MAELYKGAGSMDYYEQSLDFLDRVFFADDPEETRPHFLDFLPKLYKKEYNHCEKNMVVSEDGKWLAAVGLYINEMKVGGEKLLCGGIGNVAVSEEHRGKGYMKDCMRLCFEKCCKEDVDFMILGGQRQRYGYFGFEPAGTVYEYCLNDINIRHVFGKDYKSSFAANKVSEGCNEYLDFIYCLYHNTFPSKILRDRGSIDDILASWHQQTFVFSENGRPVGYAVYSEDMGCVMEVAAISDEYFRLLLPNMLRVSGKKGIRVRLPAYPVSYNQILADVCEECGRIHCDLINVLNWKHMIYSLLKLKAQSFKLCDGEQAFLIHGYRKDELFTVKVENNSVSVSDGGEEPAELSQKEAMQTFLGMYSEKRNGLAPNIAQWLPLEFMIFTADTV